VDPHNYIQLCWLIPEDGEHPTAERSARLLRFGAGLGEALSKRRRAGVVSEASIPLVEASGLGGEEDHAKVLVVDRERLLPASLESHEYNYIPP
jgi:hypothetical protein